MKYFSFKKFNSSFFSLFYSKCIIFVSESPKYGNKKYWFIFFFVDFSFQNRIDTFQYAECREKFFYRALVSHVPILRINSCIRHIYRAAVIFDSFSILSNLFQVFKFFFVFFGLLDFGSSCKQMYFNAYHVIYSRLSRFVKTKNIFVLYNRISIFLCYEKNLVFSFWFHRQTFVICVHTKLF